MDQLIKEIYDAVLNGDREAVPEKVNAAISAGAAPGAILNEGMIAAMGEVGRRFESGDYFVPEMLISARSMQSGMELLKPHLTQADIHRLGKVVIGTVKGDLHDIGKNLVGIMLEGAGFEVRDLGTDVAPEKFVNAVDAEGADIVALSALLTTTMSSMKGVVDALEAAGIRSEVKVLIGGAPVTDEYARQIGADAYARDAGQAVSIAKALVGAAPAEV